MSTKYGDRDWDRSQRDYGRRSDSDDDRSYGERSQGRNRYGRDENERDRYAGESRWGSEHGRGRSGSSRSSGSEYGDTDFSRGEFSGTRYGGRFSGNDFGSQYGSGQSRGSEYGRSQLGGEYSGREYGGGSRSRSSGQYRGREGYRPGSENDWDYTDDRESRYGSFVRGYDTGEYDDTSRYDTRGSSSQRYNYPTGFRSGESYGERGREYDYDRGRRDYGDERGWLDRLADKLAAWFGDEDAERRSRMGESHQTQRQRGKGPKGYRRSDERIREDINDRLSEGYLDASEVEVLVVNGEVTLTGTVNSRSDKRRAEDIAEDVNGVTHVENRLRVQQSDIDRYPSLTGTGSSLGTTGTTGTTGATGSTGTSDTSTSGTTGTTGTARGKTAGSQS